MIVPKNSATLAVIQLQMEIVYNVNTEFPFNSTENIICKMSVNICSDSVHDLHKCHCDA